MPLQLSAPFASHALTLSSPFHLPLVVIWCQTFLLFPASSPFHHPPLQLGGRHLFDYTDESAPSFLRVSTFHRFNWAAVLSHTISTYLPPSLSQFSTTPTAAFCYEYSVTVAQPLSPKHVTSAQFRTDRPLPSFARLDSASCLFSFNPHLVVLRPSFS